MPVLLRLLARLATIWAFGAMRRGAARRTPGTVPPWGSPGTAPPPDPAAVLRARLLRLRGAVAEGLRITGHALALSAFLAASAVLLTAGATATSLGPRWLGVGLLALAALALITSLLELRVVWRMRLAQRRRRHADELRHLDS